MKRTPLKRLGKRGLEWEKVRRQLKAKFERAGITSCELRLPGCWGDSALGFMHAKKRRNLGPGELSVVALGCCCCHEQIEILPEPEMTKIVLDTIANRSKAV